MSARSKSAISKFNSHIVESVRGDTMRKILHLPSQHLIESSKVFHQMLTGSVGFVFIQNSL